MILKPHPDLALIFNQFNNGILGDNSHPENIQFDVIARTKTRKTKNISVTQNIELNNYFSEHTPTESSAGGTLAKPLSYKTCSDLNIYKKLKFQNPYRQHFQ